MDTQAKEAHIANTARSGSSHPGLSLYFTTPFITIGATALTWWLTSSLATTAYAQYVLYGAIGLAFISAIVLMLLIHSALVPYLRLRKELTDLLNQKRDENDRCLYVLQGSGEGFWDYNIEKGEVFFSGQLMSMLGYAPRDQQMPIVYWYEQVHPDDRDGVKRTMDSHLDRRTPEYSIEYRMKRSNGEYTWVEDKGKAFLDANGKPVRVSGVTIDTTKIKRVQEVLESRTNELEEAQKKIEAEINNVKKFQKAVDASTESISITTPDGNLIYVNPSWVKLNGYVEMEAIGQNSRIIKSDKTSPDTHKQLWEKISTGETFFSEDITNRRKDGSEYQASVSIFPIREGEQTFFYVSICQDITLRKEIDRAKTEFVSLASHQLRTPLSAIRWYSEMLMSKYVGELNEKQQQYIHEIYQGNLRMVDLVNALLNVSRIDLGTFAVEPEPVNLVDICESVLTELTPQITQKNQTVDRLYTQAPATYMADQKLIRIIFQNFLSNSVKYTPEGGRIAVEISTKDAMLYIRVSDNGYGIPKAQQGKIFEKLFRADNVRQKDTEGTGLGMYIVKAIVEAATGKIWFDSEENKGTTFHVLLPLSGMPRKTGAKGLT